MPETSAPPASPDAPRAPESDAPRAPGPGAPRVPALDGLRGLAVLLVLLAHTSNVQLFLLPGLDFRGLGRAGVFLFFVLSAFLLTGQLLGRAPGELRSGRLWGRYALRRVLRVFPAYAACLFLYVGVEGWTLRQLGLHLALVRAELHFWTVPVEVYFYVLLPFVAAALVLLRSRGTSQPGAQLGLLLVAAVLLRVAAPPDYGSGAPDFHVSLAPFVPVFLAGSAAAVLFDAWRRRSAEQRSRWTRRLDLLAVGCALGLALHAPGLWSLLVGERVDLHHFHLEFDRFALLWAGLLLGLLCGGGALRRVFEGRPLRWVGRVSYGTYLFHKLILVHLDAELRLWPRPWGLALYLALALGAGWLSWRLLERPFLGLAASAARAGAPVAEGRGPR